MLVVRDLLCGATRFNELSRGNPRLSRTLLSKRLRQLERSGIVEHVGDEYLLTPAGRELYDIVFGLGNWAARWMFHEPRDSELDPQLLMWWVHDRLDFSSVTAERVVLEFRFDGLRPRIWIMHDLSGPSVCTFDPGFGVDVVVKAELSVLYQVWLGRIDLRRAVQEEQILLTGSPAIVRQLPEIFQLSPMAATVAAVTNAGTGGPPPIVG